MSWRPPPSKESPVVVEGLWGRPSNPGPEINLPDFSRDVIAVGLEPHVNGLLLRNLEGENRAIATFRFLSEIPLIQEEPAFLIFSGEAISDDEVEEFLKARAWIRTPLMVGTRSSKFSSIPQVRQPGRPSGLGRLARWAAYCLVTTVLCLIASWYGFKGLGYVILGICATVGLSVFLLFVWLAWTRRD